MGRFWIVGHRGSPCVEVENTLASFERAVTKDGANALEMDICLTKDDELLVWHDFDPRSLEARLRRWRFEPKVLHRPLDFDRRVSEMTLAEARKKLGFVDARPHLPTLGEVFDWARRRATLGLVFLDVKIPRDAMALVPRFLTRLERIVSERAPHFGLVLECQHVDLARAVHAARVRQEIALDIAGKRGLEEVSRLDLSWGCVQKPRPLQALFPFFAQRRVLRRLAEARAGASRCAFTINDEDEMRELLALGVSAIQTDQPERLRAIVDAWAPVAALASASASAPLAVGSVRV